MLLIQGFLLMLSLCVIALALALARISLGGGLYETGVVDPAWPSRPDIVQPARGGISRRRFWIPAHVAFEVTLATSLVLFWDAPETRPGLLVALASHTIMRIWSAFDFIPKALAFERAAAVTVDEARSWTRRSRLRLLLDLITCGGMMIAFAAAARAL